MPTLKKSIKVVRDMLKEAERLERKRSGLAQDGMYYVGVVDGLRMARRIIDEVFGT